MYESTSAVAMKLVINVKQSTVYQKQALNKLDKWLVKPSVSANNNLKANVKPSQSKGQWIEFVMSDELGKPKTVKAWVPSQN